MTRLLIYEPSWTPIRDRLAGRVEALVMDAAGRVTLDGAEVAADAIAPDVAWLNGPVFLGPAVRQFFAAVRDAPSLQWAQSGAAGFDHPMFRHIVERGARLTTSHGQAVGMADYVLTGVLDHFQRGPERRGAQAQSEWRRYSFREVMGTTWLIVGFGAIGRGVADRARAFGAKIIGVRRNPASDPSADQMVTPDQIREQLPLADVVVLSIPLSGATRHLANADFFAGMRVGSVLVNVGRGGLVDEPALLAALDCGVPAHALLDVFETEPLPAESRFWTHPSVTVTGHASGHGNGQDQRNEALFLDNLDRYLAGEPLINQVDPHDVLAAAN